jgi:hypothetical protein
MNYSVVALAALAPVLGVLAPALDLAAAIPQLIGIYDFSYNSQL